MKYWAMAWMVAAATLAGMTIGCESNQPPEEVTEFDPNVDAQPTNLVVRPAPDLVRDQAALAAKQAMDAMAAKGTGAGPSAPGAAAQDPNVTAVKGIMDKLIEGGKTGQLSVVLGYLGQADKAELTEAFTALGQLAAGATELETNIKQRFELADVPASLQQALGKGPTGGPVLASLGDLATDMLTYSYDANTSTMTVGGGNAPLILTKTADGWQIKLSAADKQVYAAVGTLAQAQIKFVQTLTQGIREGDVTKENLDEKIMGMIRDLIQPAMNALKTATESAAGGGVGAGAAP